MKQLLIAFLFLSALGFSQDRYDLNGHTHEHIVHYHSDINVLKNCTVRITETIEILVRRENINHGIYRDLPLSYLYRGGNVNVGFKILSIKYDGETEEFHTESMRNGIRIYAGSVERFVPEGIHVYEIEYEVDHVLGLYVEFDEISWNVNGNGWAFEIDSISANVYLPDGAKIKQYNAYTGGFGAVEQNYLAKEIDGCVQFASTSNFSASENMTVAVGWEKGAMNYPTGWDEFIYFIKSYILWFIGILGLVIAFLINFVTWYKYGRDPKPGTIIPLFYAPKDFSPAECIYLKNAGRPGKEMFGSTLVSLAVKGLLKIEFKKSTGYTITRLESNTDNAKHPLNEIEKKFFNQIFLKKEVFKISKSKYNSMLSIANESLIKSIDKKQNEVYYHRNKKLGKRHFIMPFMIAVFGGLALHLWGGRLPLLLSRLLW